MAGAPQDWDHAIFFRQNKRIVDIIMLIALKKIIIVREFSGCVVRVLACNSRGRWLESTQSITLI